MQMCILPCAEVKFDFHETAAVAHFIDLVFVHLVRYRVSYLFHRIQQPITNLKIQIIDLVLVLLVRFTVSYLVHRIQQPIPNTKYTNFIDLVFVHLVRYRVVLTFYSTRSTEILS